MTVPMTPFLKKSLLADALVSGAAAVLMAAGAGLLGPLLGLPTALLFWAGIVLLPWTALLLAASRHESVSRMLLLDIVGINALWAAASFGIMIAGLVQPNLLGVAFVSAQALTVALFAVLQVSAMKAARAEIA